MAEWSGRERRHDGTSGSGAGGSNAVAEAGPPVPPAPGARTSPQVPGEVPDRSSVPGHHSVTVARAGVVRRPLVELGTAQGIMGIFATVPGREKDPTRFEQATASYEELRKADLALLPPLRPAPGYALTRGVAREVEPSALTAPPVAAAESAPPAALAPIAAETPLSAAPPPTRAEAAAVLPPAEAMPTAARSTAVPPPGAVAGDGTAICPSGYPIKGNASSMIYHEPDKAAYIRTIPEFCFDSRESAEAAGFRPPRR